MSHWNYRVVRRERSGVAWFAIHEVYYGDDGQPALCSQEPTAPGGENVVELLRDVELMHLALDKPVLEYDEIGRPTPPDEPSA